VTFDLTQPINERVKSVYVRCADCDVPQYEELVDDKWYQVALCSFLATGGDAYTIIAKNGRNHTEGIICLAKHEAQAQ
jgi:hypothetical protein